MCKQVFGDSSIFYLDYVDLLKLAGLRQEVKAGFLPLDEADQ